VLQALLVLIQAIGGAPICCHRWASACKVQVRAGFGHCFSQVPSAAVAPVCRACVPGSTGILHLVFYGGRFVSDDIEELPCLCRRSAPMARSQNFENEYATAQGDG
jgi:hypothetical protein